MSILRARFTRIRASGRSYRSLHTLGIRREDWQRIWERRAPLTPEAVAGLIREGKDVKVEVETCKRRCFPDELYAKVGCTRTGLCHRQID